MAAIFFSFLIRLSFKGLCSWRLGKESKIAMEDNISVFWTRSCIVYNELQAELTVTVGLHTIKCVIMSVPKQEKIQ